MAQIKGGSSLVGRIGSYLQIVTKDPRSTAFVPLAEAYRQIGLLDDALEAASLGTRMLPHFSPGFATMGRILGQMGRIEEAMSAYARALSIDRQSQSALVGLARLHLVRGERDQARKILVQAADFHPQDEMIQSMLTALDLPRPWADLAQAPELQETSSIDEGAVAEESAAPIPTATLAEIYVKQGLFAKAIKIYQDILKQSPENTTARARLDELKQQVSGGAVAAAKPAVAVVEKVESEPIIASPEDHVGTPHDEVAAVAEVGEGEVLSPLEVLERWLDVIEQRRVHV